MANAMEYNMSPISLKEGKIFVNGVECGDGFNINIKFTPDVWTGSVLGRRGKSSRWLNGAYSGTMTRGRTNAFIKDAITHYMETGETPEITIQGIQNDKGSDYYAETGKVETVTADLSVWEAIGKADSSGPRGMAERFSPLDPQGHGRAEQRAGGTAVNFYFIMLSL